MWAYSNRCSYWISIYRSILSLIGLGFDSVMSDEDSGPVGIGVSG